MEPQSLVQWTRDYKVPVQVVPAIEDALEKAFNMLDDRSMVLVTGSLFIAAAARDTWYNQLKKVGR